MVSLSLGGQRETPSPLLGLCDMGEQKEALTSTSLEMRAQGWGPLRPSLASHVAACRTESVVCFPNLLGKSVLA